MGDNQEDCVYATANVDPVMFDVENKPVNVAVLSDVSDSLFEQETIDSSIEDAIVDENEQQKVDRNIEETTTNSPPQNHKTRCLREIYE